MPGVKSNINCLTEQTAVLAALQSVEESHSHVFCFQSGLIMACYHGYVDVVMALAQCPYVDVNWQDNEGNTALITAAQAGKHISDLFHPLCSTSAQPIVFAIMFVSNPCVG